MAEKTFRDGQKIGFADILNQLQQPRANLVDTLLPQIQPLLQPSKGIDPAIESAIARIQGIGQNATSSQVARGEGRFAKRGLTGSSIEAGELRQIEQAGQQDIVNQIVPLLLGNAQQKFQQRTNLAGFLERAGTADIGREDAFSQMIASVMGEQMGRQDMFDLQKMIEDAQPGSLEQIAPSLLGATGQVGAAYVGR